MPLKFYKEIECTINEWWDSLDDSVKEAINKIYNKYEKKEIKDADIS
tara:strand:+ start:5116 stop:5256 length:141 start_codon:yes stop_codon:yes gene_type:complete